MLLRRVLWFDAAVCAVNALAYVGGARWLDDQLGIPAGPLRAVGVFLAVYAGAVSFVATRPRIPHGAVRAVVGLNVLWAIDSLLIAALDWYTPTATGRAWIVLQGLAVAGIAAVQAEGLRRAASAKPNFERSAVV